MSSIFVAMAVVALAWAQAGAARADEPGYLGKASAYCTAKGGVVQEREPYYGTNGNSPLQLAGKQYFCQFTKKDGSQISLLLSTMWTKMPSLAALAYYAEVQYNDNCNGSPGSCYCSQLGGTDLFGGVTGAGGGWVLTTNANDVLDTCIFPDMSSIDSYGLFYHSADIIRGKNLATVLRYKNPY
jgi:hypothetical protein